MKTEWEEWKKCKNKWMADTNDGLFHGLIVRCNGGWRCFVGKNESRDGHEGINHVKMFAYNNGNGTVKENTPESCVELLTKVIEDWDAVVVNLRDGHWKENNVSTIELVRTALEKAGFRNLTGDMRISQ